MLDRNARDSRAGADPIDSEPHFDMTALSVPERDPERIAFNLWNEGRVDEAIQFLESAIAAERDRNAVPAPEPSVLPLRAHAQTDEIEPVSGWRERHRAALSPAEFNAFGAPVHTIDLVAGPEDAIVPHPPRRSVRPVWLVGLALGVTGILAAGALWSGRSGAPEETVLAAIQPGVTQPPLPHARPEVATVTPIAESADVAADDEDPDATPDAAENASADVPPPDDGPAAEVAPISTGASPATTASIGPAPGDTAPQDAAPQTVEQARLPRQRPEPPASLATASLDKPSVPVVYDPAPPPGYGPAPAQPYDPAIPRSTLTPAEYQALLERRALATEYVARRRAIAERRARGEGAQGPVLLGDPGSFARYQQY